MISYATMEDSFMEDQVLKDARIKAERAVSDMSDGDLKVKAFEVTLAHLLATGSTTVRDGASHLNKKARVSSPTRANTLSERIQLLQADGFFDTPQVIGAIREGLQVHGWHY